MQLIQIGIPWIRSQNQRDNTNRIIPTTEVKILKSCKLVYTVKTRHIVAFGTDVWTLRGSCNARKIVNICQFVVRMLLEFKHVCLI